MSETANGKIFPINPFKDFVLLPVILILIAPFLGLLIVASAVQITALLPIFVFIFYALLVLGYAYLRAITFHYSLGAEYFNLKKGILSKSEWHIPYGTIQNIFIHRNFPDRILNLGTVVVENVSSKDSYHISGLMGNQKYYMAYPGFNGNTAIIPGLKLEDATKLKEMILQKMKENPLDDNQSGL